MAKKPNPGKISVFFNGALANRFGKAYLDALGILLGNHFCEVTGLSLKNGRRFMFNIWNEVQSTGEGLLTVQGDIIGADSVAYEADATWREKEGQPVAAVFSKIPVPALVRDYSDAPSKEVPLANMPFPVEWIRFWESHLPDFFLEIHLRSAPDDNFLNALETVITATNPAYHKLVKHSRIIRVHIDFGSNSPITKNIQSIFANVATLQHTVNIKKIIVGVSGDSK